MKISKEQAINFIIQVFQWYLAIYMIDYGWGKIFGDQFGISAQNAAKPIKELDNFYVAWYLFGQSKMFNALVGMSQIAGSIFILLPRTKLFGALILLPILVNIFLIDACFTTNMFGVALPIRLTGMIFCDLAILFHSKNEVIAAWRKLTGSNISTPRYKWWLYLIIPVLGFLMDFILAIALYPVRFAIQYWIHK
jgi:hypothetical protein